MMNILQRLEALENGTVGGVTGDTLPIGSIQEWPSNVIPNNWLLCNGQAVSRTDYAELFAVLGTTYGEGDESTTFNLPNRKGVVAVGKDENDSDFNTLGKKGGEKVHVLTGEESGIQDHTHSLPLGSNGVDVGGTGDIARRIGGATNIDGAFRTGFAATNDTYTSSLTGNKNAINAHNNLQPYTVTNYIIKAHQSAGVVAEIIQEDGEATEENVYSAEAINNKFTSIVETIENETGILDKLNCIDISIEGEDLNTLVGKFIVGYGNDCINRPSNAANGYFVNIPHFYSRNSYNKQIFMPRYPNEIWVRNQENGVWDEWTKI